MERDASHGRAPYPARVADEQLPALRASDADREHTAELLRRAAGEGRLEVDELEERLQIAYATRTQRELEALVADVVVPEDRERLPRVPVKRGDAGTRWLVAVMSGHDRKGRWRVGANLNVINVMGGSDLDFNEAEFAEDVVTVTVFSLMGGADIHVPEGLNVEVSNFALMGGNSTDIGNERPDPGGPVLRLKLISIMGGSDVKRGPKLSRAERRELRRQGHRHH
jgi:uncharacterized protein DUF1707